MPSRTALTSAATTSGGGAASATMPSRNVINSPTPHSTQAARIFTMVSMDQEANSTGAHQERITDLVVRGDSGRARYLPSAPTSAYAAGMITAALAGSSPEQFGWINTAGMVNNAIVNQERFLGSLGSVVMSFNLSEGQRALRGQIETAVAETEERDPLVMSAEIERAICASAIRSPSLEEFVEATQREYLGIFATTELLASIYDEMQILANFMNDGIDPMGAAVDWEALANGTDPWSRVSAPRSVEPIDPIAGSNFAAIQVTPVPAAGLVNTAALVTQYVNTSNVLNNTVSVNTLIISNLPGNISLPPRSESPNGPRRNGDFI